MFNESKIAIIGGTGLDSPEIFKNPEEINIKTPFGKPASKLMAGTVSGKNVVILARHGENHEIPPHKVPYRANMWALKEIGCTHIITTTACGSLQEKIKPRDFIILDQFIDFTKRRRATMYDDKVIHTPMADPFCPILRKILSDTAEKLNIPHHKKGTVVTIEGPRFSSRAESHMFRILGADVINMTTVPEVVMARELNIPYASVAMATDYDCWRENTEAVTMDVVLKVMEHNAEIAKKLLLAVIPKIYWKCDLQ